MSKLKCIHSNNKHYTEGETYNVTKHYSDGEMRIDANNNDYWYVNTDLVFECDNLFSMFKEVSDDE